MTIGQDPDAMPEQLHRRPAIDLVLAIAASAITIAALLWSVGFFWRMGFEIYTEQFLATILGLSLFYVFLTIDFRRRAKASIGIVDGALAVVSLSLAAFITIDYARLSADFYHNAWETFLVGGAFVLLTTEGLRRSAGIALVVVFLAFFFYALVGHLVPGILQSRPVTVFRLVPILGIDGTSLLGMPMAVVGTIVVAFIFMGQLLLIAGGGDFFTDLAKGLMGRQRGGAAKIAVVASAFFGSISGSVVANVTSTGVITIGMMKRAGFRPHVAGAVEAVASNGGQLMPPVMGAAAFLMADFLGVSYGEIVLVALIPAILYFVAVFFLIDLEAAKHSIKEADIDNLPRVRDTLKQGWVFVLPFAVLLTLMFHFNMAPETAAIISALTILAMGLVFGYRGRRLGLLDLVNAIRATGVTSVQILIICGMAGMIISILNVTGLGFALSLLLTSVGQSSLLLLLTTTAFISIILGMSMPTASLYILLATLVVPSLVSLGALPVAAHMFVFYFGMMSFVTPPVAIAAFAAANIAGADPMRTGWSSMRFGWAAYIVPYLFVFSPSLLMIGEPHVVVFTFVTAVFGILLISAGFMGYLRSQLPWAIRIASLLVGCGLLLPVDMFPGAGYVNVAALVFAVALVLIERRRVPGVATSSRSS